MKKKSKKKTAINPAWANGYKEGWNAALDKIKQTEKLEMAFNGIRQNDFVHIICDSFLESQKIKD